MLTGKDLDLSTRYLRTVEDVKQHKFLRTTPVLVIGIWVDKGLDCDEINPRLAISVVNKDKITKDYDLNNGTLNYNFWYYIKECYLCYEPNLDKVLESETIFTSYCDTIIARLTKKLLRDKIKNMCKEDL